MAELASIPNWWKVDRHSDATGCYWCRPENFDPMPKDHSLCSRCGALIFEPGIDPFNEGMVLCPPCDAELEAEFATEHREVMGGR